MDTEVVVRKSLLDILEIKQKHIRLMREFQSIDEEISENMQEINSYEPYRIEYRFGIMGSGDNLEKNIDQKLWTYAIRLYELERFMLCTQYDKLQKEVDNFVFPVFTEENAMGWLDGLKALIYDNVNQMIKNVYDQIINQFYYTGSGYSTRQKKKRNNNGIDDLFILTTCDYSRVFGYYHKPTITDDLEKVCYIISGEKLPKITIINEMHNNKIQTGENKYFAITVCKNGNTHYRINKDIIEKLNVLGANRGAIGEAVKIKIFDDKW